MQVRPANCLLLNVYCMITNDISEKDRGYHRFNKQTLTLVKDINTHTSLLKDVSHEGTVNK